MSILICNSCSLPIGEYETIAVQDEGKLIHAECSIHFEAVVGGDTTQILCKKCDRAITAEHQTKLDSECNLIHEFCITKLFVHASKN
ncbi:MAG: hypothetical protein LLF94_08790 [Chlamydiales bacterium]|nr:hypothetical protein [Chlamydiales bacterium]